MTYEHDCSHKDDRNANDVDSDINLSVPRISAVKNTTLSNFVPGDDDMSHTRRKLTV